MIYLATIVILSISILIYFRIAEKLNIIDKPNHRSSHTSITLRGGGVIFWIAALLYFLQDAENRLLFFSGITLISLVSFWDDIRSLPNTIRITAHFISISLIFFQLSVFSDLPLGSILLMYVVAIGIINAYNFMDGINGITGLYTLSVMGTMLYINQYIQSFIDVDFIIYPMLACIVFLYFNFRKKAKCFAGDVGSISIAFWIIFLILKLSLVTGSIIWILLLAVYGVDVVCTIIHRLILKQNIFKAHRLHFYQVLSNEYGMEHRLVAIIYAIVQLLISMAVCLAIGEVYTSVIFIAVIIPLVAIYFLKFHLNKQPSHS